MPKKLIKGYTTTVPAQQTIVEIQQILAQNGARGIATDFNEDGSIKDVFFKIVVNNQELPFRLPVKVDKVKAILKGVADAGKPEDVAWRICKTWLEGQITLINLNQVKIEEVFLPYLVISNDKTLYENLRDNQFSLPSGEIK